MRMTVHNLCLGRMLAVADLRIYFALNRGWLERARDTGTEESAFNSSCEDYVNSTKGTSFCLQWPTA